MADIIIRNGRVVDGTGNPWFRGDIAITNGTIQAIGNISENANTVIDAENRIVCPGFIDMHAHPDLTIFYKETQDYKLRQGITTEVGGNCGFTAAPLNSRTSDGLKKYTSFITPPSGVTWDWVTFEDYLSAVDKSNPSTNMAPLLGQGTVRIAVLGFDQRHPTSQELSEMKSLVEEAMQAGAFGLSTGLVYVPGAYCETEEIVALAQVASQYGGIYATHMRNEGDQLIDSIEESISIGQKANIPVQISHHKAMGKANHGRVTESLDLIQRTRDQGLDITVDQYPYSASSTTLQAVLPPWSQEGGVDAIVKRLSEPESRTRIKLETVRPSGETRMGGMIEEILITEVKTQNNMKVIGHTIKEIGDMRNQEPIEVVLDLLVEEECGVGMVNFSMADSDIGTVMAHPVTMIGTDGIYQTGNPHPRVYGTYPRILGRYVREQRLMEVETAIRKMTSFPAQKLGINNKGILRVGADADIVIFDPDTVIDTGTYQNSHKYPKGIDYVLVNGQISVSEGQFTGVTSGKVIRKHNQ